jgi:hypothetical protein
MARRAARPELTPEQHAEADRILAALRQAAESDLRELAELLAATDGANTFGAAEYAVRDIALGIGAKALESALEGRKKGGTTARPSPAPTAARPPSSTAGGPSPS